MEMGGENVKPRRVRPHTAVRLLLSEERYRLCIDFSGISGFLNQYTEYGSDFCTNLFRAESIANESCTTTSGRGVFRSFDFRYFCCFQRRNIIDTKRGTRYCGVGIFHVYHFGSLDSDLAGAYMGGFRAYVTGYTNGCFYATVVSVGAQFDGRCSSAFFYRDCVPPRF